MQESDREQVRTILEPYHETLGRIPLLAWRDWMSSSEYGRNRHGRTRADIIWEHMIDHAHQQLGDDRKWQIIRHCGTFSFIARDTVLLRFKKGDNRGISSNYPTQTALAFHEPDQGSLFELPHQYRAEVVYIMNALETGLSDVRVISRNGNIKMLEYSIMPQTPVIPMEPRSAAAPDDTAELFRIRDEIRKDSLEK